MFLGSEKRSRDILKEENLYTGSAWLLSAGDGLHSLWARYPENGCVMRWRIVYKEACERGLVESCLLL